MRASGAAGSIGGLRFDGTMVALALTAAVGCVEAAPVGHVYGERGAALSFGAPTAEKNGELGFESLRRLIEAEGLTSIDDLVGRLPAALRSRYVLMHESRSLQEATYSAPRALLFTADASFVVAFNGGPTENGYLALETLEFDQKNDVFQLREVAFPAAGDARANVVFSEINPPRCLVCHGDAPRPIWDAYPEWPGAYGEVDHGALQGTEKLVFTRFWRRAGRTHVTARCSIRSRSRKAHGLRRPPPTRGLSGGRATRISATSCSASNTASSHAV